jgi:hypothetical protein
VPSPIDGDLNSNAFEALLRDVEAVVACQLCHCAVEKKYLRALLCVPGKAVNA